MSLLAHFARFVYGIIGVTPFWIRVVPLTNMAALRSPGGSGGSTRRENLKERLGFNRRALPIARFSSLRGRTMNYSHHGYPMRPEMPHVRRDDEFTPHASPSG